MGTLSLEVPLSVHPRHGILLVLSLLALQWTTASHGRPATANHVQAIAGVVTAEWQRIPANLPSQARLERLAGNLEHNYYRRLADTDHDGLPDLLVTYDSDPARPGEDRTAEMMLFRGADLIAGKISAHVLEQSGFFPKVEQMVDVTGDGRPEIVLKTKPTGSGAVSHWLVYHWTGSRYDLLFRHALDHWRGENYIKFEPGRITFTCRPWRTYEHKFDPHRVHQEVWVLKDGRFQFGQHYMPPPATTRQAVIDGEAHFRRQDYAAALALYRKALLLPPESEVPSASGKDREWRPYVHLRLGQALAILGQTQDAERELQAASAAGGYVGEAANTFLNHLPQGVPEAMAALLRMPGEPYRPEIPPATHLQNWDLAPPEVTLQLFLERNPTTAVVDLLTAIGQEFPQPHLQVDLDGDGRDEVWGMIGYNSFLGVQTPDGWRVGALHHWTRTPEVVMAPDGRGKSIRFEKDLSSHPLIGWNGREVIRVTLHGVHASPLLPPAIPRCKSDD